MLWQKGHFSSNNSNDNTIINNNSNSNNNSNNKNNNDNKNINNFAFAAVLAVATVMYEVEIINWRREELDRLYRQTWKRIKMHGVW